MKEKYLIPLAILLIGFQVVSDSKIKSLESTVELLQRDVRQVSDRFNREIGTIRSDIEARLEEKASIIADANYVIGDVDSKNLTIPITFNITPKEIRENTLVFLEFEDKTIPLERNKNVFSAVEKLDIFENVLPTIIIENDGVKQLEIHNNLGVRDLKGYAFPKLISPRFSGKITYNGGNINLDGDFRADTHMDSEAYSFDKVEIIFEVNNGDNSKEVLRKTADDSQYGTYNIELKEKIAVNSGDTLTGYALAKDRNGFIHKYYFMHYTAGSNMPREPRYRKMSIQAPNGEIVYSFDEENYKSFY